MSDREQGFYWIRFERSGWSIAYWQYHYWELVGSDIPAYESDIAQVGEKLKEPQK